MIENYAGPPTGARGRGVLLVIGVVALGLAGGAAWQRWGSRPAVSGPSSAIEWNAVQAVPRRAPDAEDVAWKKRANTTAVIASSADDQGDAIQAGLLRTSSARNDGDTGSDQRTRVIDGDTFDIGGERVRVAGIDAPETHPARCIEEARLGLAATEKLAELLRGRPLWISGTKTDRYGRSVRTVRVGGHDVAEAMISTGLARNYDGKQRQSWC